MEGRVYHNHRGSSSCEEGSTARDGEVGTQIKTGFLVEGVQGIFLILYKS